MKRSRALLAVVVFASLPAYCAPALAQDAPALTVTDAWARPGGAGGMSAVYVVLANAGARELAFSGVTCAAVTGMAHLHRSTVENDMVRMAAVDRLAVPAGGRVELRPGGLHIMLMSLRRPLEAGDTFACELLDGETVVARLDVRVRAQ